MIEKHRFAGYRIMEFSPASRDLLQEIAELLMPHEDDILEGWVRLQWDVWEPPGLTRSDLKQVFNGLLGSILKCMYDRNIESCIDYLEEAGGEMASRQFPFEALIISIHFLEQSYMRFILTADSGRTRERLIAMDEFLHAALAAIATAYFEAYRKELLDQAEVGRIVQEGLLADIPKKAVDLEIAHVYMSARERAQLGGDFLDYFSIGSNGVAFVIGDLSGHGLEAAADSVMLRSLFRGFMCENPDLPEAMARVNRVLTTELKPGQFATALAVAYDVTGKMSLVSAGHPYPVLCDSECRLLPLSGMALAIDEQSTYSVYEAQLEQGGVFVAYTDGLSEARNNGAMFGEERIVEAIATMRNASARGIAEHLIDESLRYAGGKFMDDVAVLVLKRRSS